MELKTIFFAVGFIFLFATIVYFAFQYLKDIPNEVKLMIMFSISIISFGIGEILYEKGV